MALVSPVITPRSTRQKFGSPSQPFNVWPLKIGWNPVSGSGGTGLAGLGARCANAFARNRDAEASATHQPKQNTFCIWRAARPADFELKAEYRISGGNSGFQYRSVERLDIAKWVMQGYQADIDAEQRYTGQLYEERDRGFLAPRGTFSYAAAENKPGTMGAVGDPGELRGFIRDNDWNDIHVVARGDTLVHLLNGHVMCVFLDDDPTHRKRDGLIGIQLHVTAAGMKIEARNIRIKMF